MLYHRRKTHRYIVPPSGSRYLRLYCASVGGVHMWIRELAFYAVSPVPSGGLYSGDGKDLDLTLGIGADYIQSGSRNASSAGEKAFDDSSASFWGVDSHTGAAWVGIDLGAGAAVTVLSCQYSVREDPTGDLLIQGAPDGSDKTSDASYTLMHTTTGPVGNITVTIDTMVP